MKVRAVSECKILIETFKVEEGDVIHSRGYRTDGIFQKTHSSFKVNVIRPGSTIPVNHKLHPQHLFLQAR